VRNHSLFIRNGQTFWVIKEKVKVKLLYKRIFEKRLGWTQGIDTNYKKLEMLKNIEDYMKRIYLLPIVSKGDLIKLSIIFNFKASFFKSLRKRA
jgi:hypothetical protein